MRPDQRATETQRQSVREEMHAQIDRVIDAWSVIEKQSNEMGRGFPSGGEGGSGDGGSLVERVAVGVCRCEAGRKDPSKCSCPPLPPVDPATMAFNWLADFGAIRSRMKGLDGALSRVLPLDPASVERGRQNQVDVCAWCHDPAPKVKRLDGEPHCHPDTGKTCWRSAYDLKRRAG